MASRFGKCQSILNWRFGIKRCPSTASVWMGSVGVRLAVPLGPLSRERSAAKLDLSSPVESSDSRLERRIGLQKPENLLLVSVVKAEGRAALPRNRLEELAC